MELDRGGGKICTLFTNRVNLFELELNNCRESKCGRVTKKNFVIGVWDIEILDIIRKSRYTSARSIRG